MVLGLFMNMFNTRRMIDNKVNLIEVTEHLNSIMTQESDLQMQQSQNDAAFEDMLDASNFTAFTAYNSTISKNSSQLSELQKQLENASSDADKKSIKEKMEGLERSNKDAHNLYEAAQTMNNMRQREYKRTHEIANQMKLRALKREETCWEQRKQKLETQASMFNAQKEQYGQLASAEAKESAPKFGLG